MTAPNICFIGAGNMSGSIISGLINHGHPRDSIIATTASQQSCDRVASQHGIQATTDNARACQQANVLVLGVKPQMMKQVCEPLAAVIPSDCVVVSVAAGITTSQIDQWLGGNRAVVRCMPNTPSQLMCGASGLFANARVSSEQKALCSQLADAIGVSEWVADESLIDAVTALSGSGPAYYFLLMELMEKTAIELGLEPETAHNLGTQTALGAARMASESGLSPAELRRRVTSPNGTTDRAITTFLDQGLEDIIRNGMTGARDRGRELADAFTDK